MGKTVFVGMIAGFASGIHIDTKTTEEKGCCDSGKTTNLRGATSPTPTPTTVAGSVQADPIKIENVASKAASSSANKAVSAVDKKWGVAYLFGGTMFTSVSVAVFYNNIFNSGFLENYLGKGIAHLNCWGLALLLFVCAAWLFVAGLKRMEKTPPWATDGLMKRLLHGLRLTAGFLFCVVLVQLLFSTIASTTIGQKAAHNVKAAGSTVKKLHDSTVKNVGGWYNLLDHLRGIGRKNA